MFNPLVDAIFLQLTTQSIFKVHTLAANLKDLNLLPSLDNDPSKDLFKRNFLIMNALYQLQSELLHQEIFLQVKSMEIKFIPYTEFALCDTDPLQKYYLDWQNYDTSKEEVDALLDDFWQQFANQTAPITIDKTAHQVLCKHWNISQDYTESELRKRWRQLAFESHPDQSQGNGERFKQLQNEYERLKSYLT